MNLCTGRIEYSGFFRSTQVCFGESIYAHRMDVKECLRWYDRLTALFFGVQWKRLNIRDFNTQNQKSIYVRINQVAEFLKETPESVVKMNDTYLAMRFDHKLKAIKKAKLIVNSNEVSFPLEGCQLVLQTILTHLDLPDLAACSRISKAWAIAANCPLVWKTAIYRTIAFKNEQWRSHLGIKITEDETEEFASLPNQLVNEFKRFHRAFPKTNAKDGLALVRIPQGLTINILGNALRAHFPTSIGGFRFYYPSIKNQIGDVSVIQSKWILMTKKTIPGSRGESYGIQQARATALAENGLKDYRVPHTLEAICAVVSEYFRTNTRLFTDAPVAHTRCQENVFGHQVMIGAFAPGQGVGVYYYGNTRDHRSVGVAAVKELTKENNVINSN